MTQPALYKQSFLILTLATLQTVMPTIVAVATLYASIILTGTYFVPSASTIVIVTVACLILIQPPREMSTQFTSPRVSAVVDVVLRWFLVLALLLAVAYVTKSQLQSYPRSIFLT